MPRLVNRHPAYCRHKASGQAVVTLGGQDIYLGPYGTATSKREYDRVIGEYLSRGRQFGGAADSRRVADVIKAYWDFARGYYAGPQCRTELGSFKLALGVLWRLYGDTLAAGFGPLALQTVRKAMIELGWSRSYVNKQAGRIKRCFKWAAAQELVPPAVFHGLQAVAGLRKGKTDARETDPVKPVPADWVDATIPHVATPVAGLIRLQWASGMRPGEAVIMRGCDLDTSGQVWVYTPQRHKTEHHGHAHPIFLGPQAQAVIRPFLKLTYRRSSSPPPPPIASGAKSSTRRERRRCPAATAPARTDGNAPAANRPTDTPPIRQAAVRTFPPVDAPAVQPEADRRTYGQRAQSETVNSMIKRNFGDALRSVLPERREQEMLLRTLTHNVMLYANREG
jgi:integrase